MVDFSKLFYEKTNCLLFDAVTTTHDTGRIGGNAPIFFEDNIFLINSNGIEYYFYLTMKNPMKLDSAISVFIPKDYDYSIENNIYPKCSVKIIEHEICDESTKTYFTNNEINKHYLKFTEECDTKETVEKKYLIKFGGEPDLIQEEEYYYEALEKENYNFLLQIDENGYPETLLSGNYPFGYGALYIYGKIEKNNFQNILAGFWQYS